MFSWKTPIIVLGGSSSQSDWRGLPIRGSRELVEVDADHNTLAGDANYWKRQINFAKEQVKRKREKRSRGSKSRLLIS